MENIIINKIETKAMEAALLQDQTPFALFKPAKGIPVLVKVNIPESGTNHVIFIFKVSNETFRRNLYKILYLF